MQIPPDHRHWAKDSEIVKKKAKQMAIRNHLRPADAEDLEQDVAMHVYKQSGRHNPARGSREAFIGRVTKNALLNLMEKRYAKKRDHRRDREYGDVDEDALLDGEITPERIDLKIEVQDALARLPADLREIALLRIDTSEAEIAKSLGMTRGEVRWALLQVESALRAAGIGPGKDKK
jgi:RNA polymerase sigma factor (sigma-70 family)